MSIPKVRGLPFLGSALNFGPAWALAARERLGDVFAFDLPRGNGGVMVTHPDDVRAVLIDKEGITRQEFPRDPKNLLARATGDGVVARSGEPWVERRAMMQPSFRRQRLADLLPIMCAEVDRLLADLDARYVRARRPFDAQPFMNTLSLNALVRALFSSSIGDADIDRAREAVELTMRALILGPLPLGKERMLARAERGFAHVAYRLIAERREQAPSLRPRDLLTAMLEMRDARGEELTDDSVRFELIGLLIAGKETSAIALSWLLTLLPQMPAVERRLVDEVDDVLGPRAPEADDLPRLRYMRMVLQETLRRYTPVWVLFPREARDDVALGGHDVPRGTRVWVSPYVTHHHPAFWDAPGEFAPERFASDTEDPQLKHRYAWLPFGGGPRVCLGSRFAMMGMQLAVARILQRYRVRWAGRGPARPRVIFNTLLPREVPVELVPRA